jgi:hypothetical protein
MPRGHAVQSETAGAADHQSTASARTTTDGMIGLLIYYKDQIKNY